MEVVRQIAILKKAKKMKTFQKKRMEELIENLEVSGEKKGLGKKYIRNLYKVIHNESVNRQTEIIDILEKKGSAHARSL